MLISTLWGLEVNKEQTLATDILHRMLKFVLTVRGFLSLLSEDKSDIKTKERIVGIGEMQKTLDDEFFICLSSERVQSEFQLEGKDLQGNVCNGMNALLMKHVKLFFV